ncbi:MAG: hypothetical protein CO186_08285 [Zetaproteobacteria bacterium CG_4_9_14_3_um_filter_49_83]|nr:MAG: hypothetical protein AUJ56_08500 [Zetaproteobacteria bacterium CG1_02_49_23]PIQ34038.1 MAG: hypothetical protein COW62_03055 [Zetaproteobacteria bacterium CG17_big_fil_post_rev_8_21_14_2_50_50_13]PIV29479.1 MAG: hypothetical protein COS35_11835 [Zetaproteobacteria bacterium CG02_land_8_20_14_3_00_50_9]PIY55914.1 MAG: hypothetical protein COZ00_07285 [Zetaproteobacteria bacterium CG_4_10_14_0_8_um_filter_49_80]PJA35044.1 MAG: hypothetical protein CO186_08285 [Zetaproteobacteria bacterium
MRTASFNPASAMGDADDVRPQRRHYSELKKEAHRLFGTTPWMPGRARHDEAEIGYRRPLF